MKLVFFGTPDFAAASLDAIWQAGHEIAAVVTAPDKPSGRGLQLSTSAVKNYALEKRLLILQPDNLKHVDFIETLQKLNADIFIVVAFRMLPEVVWNMPPRGTYNLHASLLPQFRGAAPINWAIIKGATQTGLTTFKLQHTIDSGDILLQHPVSIGPNTQAGELYDQLKIEGAGLLVRTLQLIEQAEKEGKVLEFKKQNDEAVTHAPKINKETGHIRWMGHAKDIHNLVRGLSPVPGAWTTLIEGGKRTQIKIYQTKEHTAHKRKEAGQILTDGRTYLHIQCGEGVLEVQSLQAEGRKRMQVDEFLRGWRYDDESYFE